jgi:hypothetical protein
MVETFATLTSTQAERVVPFPTTEILTGIILAAAAWWFMDYAKISQNWIKFIRAVILVAAVLFIVFEVFGFFLIGTR